MADANPGALAVPSRYERDNGDLLARLRRIEGQVRGIQRMIEEDRHCVEILTQLAAVKAAVNQAGKLLLESHTRGCVAHALQSGDGDRAIAELVDVIDRFCR